MHAHTHLLSAAATVPHLTTFSGTSRVFEMCPSMNMCMMHHYRILDFRLSCNLMCLAILCRGAANECQALICRGKVCEIPPAITLLCFSSLLVLGHKARSAVLFWQVHGVTLAARTT